MIEISVGCDKNDSFISDVLMRIASFEKHQLRNSEKRGIIYHILPILIFLKEQS